MRNRYALCGDTRLSRGGNSQLRSQAERSCDFPTSRAVYVHDRTFSILLGVLQETLRPTSGKLEPSLLVPRTSTKALLP